MGLSLICPTLPTASTGMPSSGSSSGAARPPPAERPAPPPGWCCATPPCLPIPPVSGRPAGTACSPVPSLPRRIAHAPGGYRSGPDRRRGRRSSAVLRSVRRGGQLWPRRRIGAIRGRILAGVVQDGHRRPPHPSINLPCTLAHDTPPLIPHSRLRPRLDAHRLRQRAAPRLSGPSRPRPGRRGSRCP